MMTEVAESHEIYRTEFEQVQRQGAENLRSLRERAFGQFVHSGWPTTRLEPWRFTNVAPIARSRFRLPSVGTGVGGDNTADVAGAIDHTQLAPFELAGIDGPRVVCINGRFSSALSGASLATLPAGVEVRGLADVLATNPALVESHLSKLAGFDTPASSFTALNTGLLQDGVVVRVAAHTVVETPIQLLFVTAGGGQIMTHPRVLVLAGEQSQLRLVESYGSVPGVTGDDDTPYFTNAVTEVVVGDGAVVDHHKLVRERAQAYHIASMHLTTGRGSTFSSHAITLGGAIVRNDVRAEMNGEDGECTLNGLYLANGRSLVDNHTTIHHAAPHCNSHELYKGILDDQSRAVFNGKIIVAIDAQKTDAKQTNKALLLSEDAQINTKPELEIFANDVRCTHGATIGQLDENALFYLRARGLDVEQARNVLIHAFASDLLNRITIPSIRAQLDDVLLQQLPGTGHASFAIA